jgi:uncharacterized membrane protein YcaP (DUF421 family)
MSELWWGSWEGVTRAVVLTTGGYIGLVLLLRVALGSMLATTALSPSVPLATGLAAVATVIALQFGISWLTLRSELVRKVVKADPALLYFRGEFLRDRMRKERIAEEEIRAAVREAGHGTLESVAAVVLETNANLGILVENVDQEDLPVLKDVTLPE